MKTFTYKLIIREGQVDMNKFWKQDYVPEDSTGILELTKILKLLLVETNTLKSLDIDTVTLIKYEDK